MFKATSMVMFLLALRSVPALCDTCDEWFTRQKIRPGKGCLMECVIAPVGMGTFSCNQACPNLCKVPLHEEALFRVAYYPGLSKGNSSEAEKAMDVANNRLGILVAQQLIKEKTFSLETLSQRGLKALKGKELIVLNPRGVPE